MSGSGAGRRSRRDVDVTVGIDIGTTAVKAAAVDGEGTVVARARLPHPVSSPQPGAFEHDVDQAWRADVVAALAAVAGDRPVAAVNVSAMVPSLAAVGADGRGLGPGLLYGDHRGIGDGPRPDGAGDAGELLAFLRWQAAIAPEAAGFWPAQAVANHALTGRGAIDSTVAMTAMPLFGAEGWDEALAAEAGATGAALPAVVAGTDAVGTVQVGLAAAGALVGPGTVDALAEQLVAGADDVGDVLVLCGTTLIPWVVTDDWQEVEGLWTIPHTMRGRVLVGGPSNAGGLFLDAVRRWLGSVPERAAGSVDPGDVPVWLPYVRGERCPLHRRDLRVALDGVGVHHGPEHLLAAAYEASAFVVRRHIELAAGAGASARRIVATGGGTRSEGWMQALADVTGLPVDVAAVPDGAAVGAAFMARCTAGLERRPDEARRWARTDRTVEPRASWNEAAAQRYDRFKALTAAALT